MNSIVHHTHPMLTRFDLAESRFRWMAPLTILVVFCSACHALGQAIPKVAGEIEDVWVSDRVSWLEGPSFGAGDVWFNVWQELKAIEVTLTGSVPAGRGKTVQREWSSQIMPRNVLSN